MLGMTPAGTALAERTRRSSSWLGQSLGAILVACSKKGVAVLPGNHPDQLIRTFQDRFREALVARVVGFVEALWICLDLSFHVCGTAFPQRVWRTL